MDSLALLICGFIFGFTLAFGIGANDVANTFGTTVGSGAITIFNAFILASFCETLGAVLLGGGVVSAISKGVIDVTAFKNDPDLLMLGYLSALIASTIWLIVASVLKLPVSGTQSAVGSMVGMGVVVLGFGAINWTEIVRITLSWVISPVMSGVISAILYVILKATIFMSEDTKKQLKRGLLMLPIFYAVTLSINVFACLFERPPFITLPNFEWPWYISIITAVVVAVAAALAVHFFYNPRLERRIVQDEQQGKRDAYANEWLANPVPYFPTSAKTSEAGSNINNQNNESVLSKLRNAFEWPGLFPIFWLLQVITSCFAAIAHGGNDVANAVAPITGMYEIYKTGEIPGDQSTSELWILFYGGVGITVGLWALGRNVIKTIGGKLANINPPRGFVIELGTTATVLIANQIGLPISTTFCKVGSVVFVGMCNGRNEVSWRVLFNVVMAWVFTVPISALMSAGVMAALTAIFHIDPSHRLDPIAVFSINLTNQTIDSNFHLPINTQ